MRPLRRSSVRSSRGHVRVDKSTDQAAWGLWALGAVVVLVGAIVVLQRVILPALRDDAPASSNRTWLEYAWTEQPVSREGVSQLADRLKDNGISRVYLEAAAWRRDGLLVEGEHVKAFVDALRGDYQDIEILLWLRMSGEEIADPVYRDSALALAQKAVHTWDFDGVQLNGRTILSGSESFIAMVRALNEAIGSPAVLSITVRTAAT